MVSAFLLLAASWQPSVTAIVGARIEIGDGRVLEKGTIVLRDGLIDDVGETAPVPAGAEVIDGKGLVVYPGFIDAYTTRGLRIPAATSRATAPDTRTTAPATMWAGNRRGIRPDVDAATSLNLEDFDDWYSQGVLAAMVSPGGGMIRGRAAVIVYTDQKDRQVLTPGIAMEFGFRVGQAGPGGGPPGGPPGG
ncbi:MAG TPA: hypothetical protein PLL78_14425, partial [Fimbriimonadaceae bacterium]|nr:hypothetical protein [Fimbriimonadaceae bacterium]